MSNMSNSATSNTSRTVKIGILSAIASVLMVFPEISILPAFPFLQLDFSEIPALLGGLFLGPVAGVLIELIKNIFHLFVSHTGYVGELASFLIGSSFILPVIFTLKAKKDNYVLAFIVGIISTTIMACIFNYFIFVPLYMPNYKDIHYYLLFGVVPFNIIKTSICSVITFYILKITRPLLKE